MPRPLLDCRFATGENGGPVEIDISSVGGSTAAGVAPAGLCERLGIKAEISDKGAYLLKVRLRKAAKAS